ncbi:hypothetical protein HYS95_01665 [Candidatus Daviesbacteria bacterium]|nr:hypothetical protein [Candidatus Daviesbacteria bacterium]
MDNNNNPVQPTPVQPAAAPDSAPVNPVQPNPAPTAPAQPPISPANPQTPNTTPEKGSNKMIMWFIIGIVIIVVAVGGFYLYSSRQQAVDSGKQAVSTQTPAPVTQENLEDELNSVSIDTADSDFASLDADLQQL